MFLVSRAARTSVTAGCASRTATGFAVAGVFVLNVWIRSVSRSGQSEDQHDYNEFDIGHWISPDKNRSLSLNQRALIPSVDTLLLKSGKHSIADKFLCCQVGVFEN